MTFPAILFGLLISCLIGSAFHFWRGGSLGRLILYLGVSTIGFWVGQLIGDQIGLRFWSIGVINLGACLMGSFLFLGVGYWLSLIKPVNVSKNKLK